MEKLNLNLSQKQVLAENFRDEFTRLQIQNESKKRVYKTMGTAMQAVMLDAIRYKCQVSPVYADIFTKNGTDSEGEPVQVEWYRIKLDVFIPGTDIKVQLVREFPKLTVENW